MTFSNDIEAHWLSWVRVKYLYFFFFYFFVVFENVYTNDLYCKWNVVKF